MVERSIRRRRKSLPAGTTFAANKSLPMSDSSSLLVALCLPSQHLISPVSSSSLSGGRRSCLADVSRTMPRKVKAVVGPSSFSGATGMPKWSHTISILDIAS